MTFYLSDEEISAMFYGGETVPDDNTIIAAQLEAYKSRVLSWFKSRLRLLAFPDDIYEDFKEASYDLFQNCLNGESLKVPEPHWSVMRKRYKQPPLKNVDPRDYGKPA